MGLKINVCCNQMASSAVRECCVLTCGPAPLLCPTMAAPLLPEKESCCWKCIQQPAFVSSVCDYSQRKSTDGCKKHCRLLLMAFLFLGQPPWRWHNLGKRNLTEGKTFIWPHWNCRKVLDSRDGSDSSSLSDMQCMVPIPCPAISMWRCPTTPWVLG